MYEEAEYVYQFSDNSKGIISYCIYAREGIGKPLLYFRKRTTCTANVK